MEQQQVSSPRKRFGTVGDGIANANEEKRKRKAAEPADENVEAAPKPPSFKPPDDISRRRETIAACAKARQKCSQLEMQVATHLEEAEEEKDENFSETFQNTMKEMEENYRKIEDLQIFLDAGGKELASDAAVFRVVSRRLVQTIESCSTGTVPTGISVKQFVSHLVSHARNLASELEDDGEDAGNKNPLWMDNESQNSGTNSHSQDFDGTQFNNSKAKLRLSDWARIGRKYESILQLTPPFTYLRPAIKSTAMAPREQKTRRAARTRDVKEKLVELKTKEAEEEELEGSFLKEMKHAHKCLRQCWTRSESTRFGFYEFVIDPDDFGRSIENLFHTSFLIKDGVCRLQLSEEGLPELVKCDREEKELLVNQKSSLESHQAIFSLDHALWTSLKSSLEIKRPCITPVLL